MKAEGSKVLFPVDKMPISLENMKFAYGDKVALKGVDFEFDQGMLIGVAGKPGSGKTTLMQLLGDVVEPDEGSIFAPPTSATQQTTEDYLCEGYGLF